MKSNPPPVITFETVDLGGSGPVVFPPYAGGVAPSAPDKPAIIRRIAAELGDLTAEKNAAYGDSFYVSGEILTLLYPNGVQPAQYGDMLAAARIVDKLGRLATRKDAFGESPYRDIAGYGLIGAVADEVAKGIGA